MGFRSVHISYQKFLKISFQRSLETQTGHHRVETDSVTESCLLSRLILEFYNLQLIDYPNPNNTHPTISTKSFTEYSPLIVFEFF